MGRAFWVVMAGCVWAEVYDFQGTSVHSLSSENFETRVTGARSKQAALVHFYRTDDGSVQFVQEINALAKDWQGAFVIGAVDCGSCEELCEQQEVVQVPTLRVYPPYPIPSYTYEGPKAAKSLLSDLAVYLTARVTPVTLDSLPSFLASKSSAKVLLFTAKQQVPTIYKALSAALAGTIDFGIVYSDQTELIMKYYVSSLPKVVVIEGEDRVREYNGELKYRSLFEFLNVYSEVFVVGKAEEIKTKKKLWEDQPVPQLTPKSYSDLCLKREGFICAIYVTSTPVTDEVVQLLLNAQEKFASGSPERLDIAFMWLDAAAEPQFLQSFPGTSAPALVYVKQTPKPRYARHTGVFTPTGISIALQKILKGTLDFVPVKGKFPKFN